MLFIPVSGKLYLIGEKDFFDGKQSNYFKIGIVKNEREVEERLFEHKTGNPRELVVCHSLDSLAVEYLETNLHHRFATRVAQSEWFRLSPEEYQNVVSMAEQLASELDLHVPYVNQALELDKLPSNGEILEPESELLSKHLKMLPSRLLEIKISKVVSKVRSTLAERHAKVDKPNPAGTILKEYDFPLFDSKRFQNENPEIAALYQKAKVSGTFRVNAPKEISDEINNLNIVKDILDIEIDDVEKLNDRDLEQSRRELDEAQAIKTWESNNHEAIVRAAIGENDGISDVATWKRAVKSVFDANALKKAEPELYAEYVEIQKRTRMIAINAGQDEGEQEEDS